MNQPLRRTSRFSFTTIVSSAVLLLLTSGLMAAGPDDQYYDRLLLPIAPVPGLVAGANGSMWSVMCVGRNDSDLAFPITASTPPIPGVSVGFVDNRAPHSSFEVVTQTLDPNVGAFVFVPKGGLPSVSFSLRVSEISRMSGTWGTTIPVVREQQLFNATATINDVPADSAFRSMLRVYDFDTPAARQVSVSVFDDDASTIPIMTRVLTLNGANLAVNEPPHDEIPGHAALDLTALVPPSSHRLRVQLQSASQGLRFWAFVATTHNTTQFITLQLPD